MHYFLKTFFPFAQSKKYCISQEEVIEKLDEILDLSEKFYQDRGCDIDVESLLSMDEGYRIFSFDPKMIYPKLLKFFKKEGVMMYTREMHDFVISFPSRRNLNIIDEGPEDA